MALLELIPQLTVLVLLPVLLTVFSLVARARRGQPPTAGLDFLIVVALADFTVALQPEPFSILVDESWLMALRPIYLSLAVVCLILFLLLLGVEERVSLHSAARYYEGHPRFIPSHLRDARLPWLGILTAWFVDVSVFSSSLVLFVL